MLILFHILGAVAYTAIAATVALGLPSSVPFIDPNTSVIAGGLLWVACVVSHDLFVRLRQQTRVTDEIADQKTAYRQVMGKLSSARAQVRLIQEALEAGAGRRNNKESREIKAVVDEVQVLKRLVEQLSAVSSTGGSLSTPSVSARLVEGQQPGDGLARLLTAPTIEESLGEAEILDIMREGLKSDRVDLFLQPIVSLPQRRRRYFECFSRIQTPEDTMVVPEQYLDIAEREGLISTIDNMLLFRCVQLVRKSQQRRFNLGFFYNISPHTLVDTDFFTEFTDFMIQNEELAPDLIFEFAQADIAAQNGTVTDQLSRLSDVGFRYSMDQVTSLEFDCTELAARHFTHIKIEGSRLLSILEPEGGDEDVRSRKRKLDVNGIDLVVEKIETEPMLVELLDFDVDYGQGYLFGEPRQSRDV